MARIRLSFPRIAFQGSDDYALLLLRLLAVASFSYAAYAAFGYAHQPLLDGSYAFRQTQTALTAYWLGINGFRFAYETPVGGAPWSMPFEFPIYQYLVVLISRAAGTDLSATGRVVSFLFLAATLVPVRAVIQRLGLSRRAFPVFVALLFSSPVYLYWARTFMIETAALFFCVASIPWFLDMLNGRMERRSVFFFLLFSSLALLQKITTGLPLLMVLATVMLWRLIRGSPSFRKACSARNLALMAVCFGIPLALGLAWTAYSDHVKSSSPLGVQLTSRALWQSRWNFGTLDQRLMPELYTVIFGERIFSDNLAGWFGAALFAGALLLDKGRQFRSLIVASMAAGLLPVLLFWNLHWVHTYYQAANVIYLLFGAAVIVGELLPVLTHRSVATLLVSGVMVLCNARAFQEKYLPDLKEDFTPAHSVELRISGLLKSEVPAGGSFVAFGNDWSSTFSFFSQRKSFTVPPWFARHREVLQDPERFVGESTLGAVVIYPGDTMATPGKLLAWSRDHRKWKVAELWGCYVALPERSAPERPLAPAEQFRGGISFAGDLLDPGTQRAMEGILSIKGWTEPGKEGGVEGVFVTLTDGNHEVRVYEAIRTAPASSGASGGGAPDKEGFSLLLDSSGMAGEVRIKVSRSVHGRLQSCLSEKSIVVTR